MMISPVTQKVRFLPLSHYTVVGTFATAEAAQQAAATIGDLLDQLHPTVQQTPKSPHIQ